MCVHSASDDLSHFNQSTVVHCRANSVWGFWLIMNQLLNTQVFSHWFKTFYFVNYCLELSSNLKMSLWARKNMTFNIFGIVKINDNLIDI